MNKLLDTDIVNYLIRSDSRLIERYARELRAGHNFILSPVVHLVVTRYLKLKSTHRLQRAYSRVIQSWRTVDFMTEDWNMAADLWAQRHRLGRPTEDADLLIAVTALKTGSVLVTNKERHYQDLGLTLENWTLP
ncbi:MAG: PIN domain-containing protein [Armatimonadetes bacterium]|nr:PIN domain-containing protein [Armatimonadota bacterium]